MFMFALNLLHRFRNELACSLTNGNHFSSTAVEVIITDAKKFDKKEYEKYARLLIY